eukprot:m.83176 g.83176  ORF g.83176 m.83176 type:complete len:302 (+) comp12905_c0_seq2:290-1195(+)
MGQSLTIARGQGFAPVTEEDPQHQDSQEDTDEVSDGKKESPRIDPIPIPTDRTAFLGSPPVKKKTAFFGDATGDAESSVSDDHENDSDHSGHSEKASDGEDKVRFRWEGDAQSVKVAGTFNDWGEPIEIPRVGPNTFEIQVALPEGQYEYKYIVDSVWKHDPQQPVIQNAFGSVNNFFKNEMKSRAIPRQRPTGFHFDSEVTLETLHNFGRDSPPGEYSTDMPDFSSAKPPPNLPPLLLESALNSQATGNDPSQLPEPKHVLLNHLYALSVKDNVMVLGTSYRFKKKFVTTVLYKPVEPAQ